MATVVIGGSFAFGNLKPTKLIKGYLTDGVEYRLTDENGSRLYLMEESKRDERKPGSIY